MSLQAIRKRYPVTKKGVFLNHAATAPVSYATIKRMKSLCDEMQEPLGKHFYPWLGIMEETRRLLAELLICDPSEIALTPNTSTALSIIAGCLDFKEGDRILVPRDEFPSNRYVWQNLRAKGVACTFFDLPHEKSLIEVLEKQDLTHVRLISVSLVSYLTGRKHDLAAFGNFCRKHGIVSCVDAIQGVGTFPLNLKEAPVDFLVGGAQKWLLGPIGCGYLYIRKELIDHVNVPLVGWTSTHYPETFDSPDLTFAPEATRFEAGLPSITSIGGLNQSLRELKAIGWEHIYERIAANSRYLTEHLDSLFSNPKELGAIITCTLPKEINPKKLYSDLAQKGITITARGDYMRIAPHFYTSQAELDLFLKVIGKATTNRHLFFPQPKKEIQDEKKEILVVGATGTLGKEIAHYLLEKGFHVTGIGRNKEVLEELKHPHFEAVCLDLTDTQALTEFGKTRLGRYSGLINCAGNGDATPFASLDPQTLSTLFQTNTFAPTFLMQQFVSRLSTKSPLGILNILSPTGRIGYPLLGGYSASQAALWTLSESLSRELSKTPISVTTYLAPPMHSPLQKRLGRTFLRYFKMSGIFNYAHAEEVARHATKAFLDRKKVVIRPRMRLQLLLNALFPKLISRKIAKAYRPEEEI